MYVCVSREARSSSRDHQQAGLRGTLGIQREFLKCVVPSFGISYTCVSCKPC